MPRQKRISERKIILFTGGLLIFAGLIRQANYLVGDVLIYLSFVPYYVVRIKSVRAQMGNEKTPVEKFRIFILVCMFIAIAMNITGWQEAKFLLFFLLMFDFLLVTNQKL